LEEAASLRSWHKASKIDEVEEEISEVMVIGSTFQNCSSFFRFLGVGIWQTGCSSHSITTLYSLKTGGKEPRNSLCL